VFVLPCPYFASALAKTDTNVFENLLALIRANKQAGLANSPTCLQKKKAANEFCGSPSFA
jgi:hypothetical protein